MWQLPESLKWCGILRNSKENWIKIPTRQCTSFQTRRCRASDQNCAEICGPWTLSCWLWGLKENSDTPHKADGHGIHHWTLPGSGEQRLQIWGIADQLQLALSCTGYKVLPELGIHLRTPEAGKCGSGAEQNKAAEAFVLKLYFFKVTSSKIRMLDI